jgi:hypothetical protein
MSLRALVAAVAGTVLLLGAACSGDAEPAS